LVRRAAVLSWRAAVTAFALAAAAATTFYFLTPPRITLEDVIAEGNQVVEPAGYATADDPMVADNRTATPIRWMLDGD
jgi:hypothetical protein